jgi:hypothetical protein
LLTAKALSWRTAEQRTPKADTHESVPIQARTTDADHDVSDMAGSQRSTAEQ